MPMTNDDRQVHPDHGMPHVVDGGPCWCRPRVVVSCTQCDDSLQPDPSCWLCAGEGLIDAPDPRDPGVATITIHNER